MSSHSTHPTHSLQATLPLAVSEAAAAKVKQLIAEENNPSLCLRALVTPGGCQGLEYGFAFDEEADIDKTADEVFKTHGITLVVDNYVLEHYLKGAIIDYQADINGERFVVNNPNAASSCGCGTSFCEKKEESVDASASCGRAEESE